MLPIMPIRPFGGVVSCARAYARETYGRALRVPIGPNSDFSAPGSPDHAGFCRHPVPPMSAHPSVSPPSPDNSLLRREKQAIASSAGRG